MASKTNTASKIRNNFVWHTLYEVIRGNGFNEEFMWSDKERERAQKYGSLTNNLHTDLHECLGHASGKLLPGVDPDALKAYGSAIEEVV